MVCIVQIVLVIEIINWSVSARGKTWTYLKKYCSDGDLFAAVSTSKKKKTRVIEGRCKIEIMPIQHVTKSDTDCYCMQS
jgi:hypothetical protein